MHVRLPAWPVVILASLASGGAIFAHHSFTATYFQDRRVTISATLQQFYFRNPHSFLLVQTKENNGEVVKWMVEWSGGGSLGRKGITRETLRPGDVLIIAGNPGRNLEDHRLRVTTISRPSDGWGWFGDE
jgi:hypothetical protein